jgi:glutamate formiminotransferase
MPLLSIPNVSDGRRPNVVASLSQAVTSGGGRVLDVHSDEIHNRTVITSTEQTVAAMTALAKRARVEIDLRLHSGVHPRLGSLDVCPIVPHETKMDEAVLTARSVGEAIAGLGVPVYFYGAAARREDTRDLGDLRRGGLPTLVQRAASVLPPDLGPRLIDPRVGVVCVGARDVLIAFNVWVRSPGEVATTIAQSVRAPGRIKALGLEMDRTPTSQVSMNLVDPDLTGIDAAFAAVNRKASSLGVEVVATEIVGLVPERFLPDPDAKAARLLMAPGRSIESALAG